MNTPTTTGSKPFTTVATAPSKPLVITPVVKPPTVATAPISRALDIVIQKPLEHELIGLIGAAGVGKTTFCTGIPNRIKGFPNPLILDFDRKCPPGIPTIPFWDDAFVNRIRKPLSNYAPANRRDALTDYLKNNVSQLSQYTLILDSWTAVQASFDTYTDYELPDREGDAVFAFFRRKISHAEQVLSLLRAIPTTSIVTVHETIERDKKTHTPTGKYRPYMEGKFADVLATKFTDFVRFETYPTAIDFDTGKPILKDGKPYELTDNNGYYFCVVPTNAFTPVLGHNKTDYIIRNKLSYVPATYENWVKLSTPQA